MTGRHSPDHGLPELKWPTDPNVYGIIADGADTGHVAVQLADGTIRTDRRDTPTVDTFLRDPERIERTLREIADAHGLSGYVLPRPIMDRIRDRAADRRNGRSIRRYRGDHRRGTWTVDALTEAVVDAKSADRAAHRRSLRRPFDPSPVYLGSRWTGLRFYTAPGDPTDPATMTGTLTIEPDDEVALSVPVLRGPPGPGEPPAADDADTGPLMWQPATAMLADMFEPWPSVEALCSTPA